MERVDLGSFLGDDDEPPTIPEIHTMVKTDPEQAIENIHILIDTLPEVPEEQRYNAVTILKTLTVNRPEMMSEYYSDISEWLETLPDDTLMNDIRATRPLLRVLSKISPHIDAEVLHNDADLYLRLLTESPHSEISEWTLPLFAKLTAHYPDEFADEDIIESFSVPIEYGTARGEIHAIDCLNNIAKEHPEQIAPYRDTIENVWGWGADNAVTPEWVNLLYKLSVPPVRTTPPETALRIFTEVLMANSTPPPVRVTVIATITNLLATYPQNARLYDYNMARFVFNEITHGDERVVQVAAEHTILLLHSHPKALSGVTHPSLDDELQAVIDSPDIEIEFEEAVIDSAIENATALSTPDTTSA